MYKVLKKAKMTIKEQPVVSTIYLMLTFFVVGSLFMSWLFVMDMIKKYSSSQYMKELIEITKLDNDDYIKKTEQNFQTWRHPYYKSLWGLMLLQEMQKNNSSVEQKIDLVSNLIKERGLPYITRDVLRLYLAQLNMSLNRKELSLQIVESISSKSPFLAFALETKFNHFLLNNKSAEYEEMHQQIEKIGPSKTLDRVSELLYIARYQPYILHSNKN